jgi:phage regulator Rha-like protein
MRSPILAQKFHMNLVKIQDKIYSVNGLKVMLDFDLAQLYGVETRVLNQAIKRNIDSFPKDFMFRLSAKHWKNMSSQFVMTYPNKRPLKSPPYVFTEHGVTMLASVLKSPRARKMNIAIVRAFIALKRIALKQADVMQVLKELKDRVGEHDVQLNYIYDSIEKLLDEQAEQKNRNAMTPIGFKTIKPISTHYSDNETIK